MNSFFLHITFIFFLFVPGYLYGQADSPADSATNINAIRPIDLVIQQTDWNTASPDFYTYWLDSGLYGYYGLQPKVLLDGLPTNVNFWGWQNLNMLPIYLPKVTSVISRPEPLYYKNTFHQAGILDFLSSKPDSGWTASANIYWGNETGDPGPWIYDSTRVTPNVDRWGPDVGTSLSFGKGEWYTKGVFSLRNHQQTDPVSHRRLHKTMQAFGTVQFYPIQTTTKSGLIESGYRTKTWALKARTIFAEDRNYLFLQPFGREVPVRAGYQQLAVEGIYNPNQWALNLQYILEEKDLGRRNKEHEYIFDWNEVSSLYSGALTYAKEPVNVKAGIEFKNRIINAPGIPKEQYGIPSFSLSTRLKISERTHFRISTDIDLYQKKNSRKF